MGLRPGGRAEGMPLTDMPVRQYDLDDRKLPGEDDDPQPNDGFMPPLDSDDDDLGFEEEEDDFERTDEPEDPDSEFGSLDSDI